MPSLKYQPLCAAFAIMSSVAFSAPPPAVPGTLSHQGRIAVNGVNHDGPGEFKFLLYHGTAPGTGTTALWKNDEAAPTDASEPSTSVTTAVMKGLYSIALGESPQEVLPLNLKPPYDKKLYLRIWFSDGANGFQMLSPDREIHSVPFAKHAGLEGENISQLNNDSGYLRASTSGTINGNLNVTGNLDVRGNASFGEDTLASGGNSVAFGHEAEATGLNSVAWGFSTAASTTSATAWGSSTTASGQRSTAWGIDSTSSGKQSTAWGEGAVASGDSSTAWGKGTTAPSFVETSLGHFNTSSTPQSATEWNVDDRLLVVGNGKNAGVRSDALVMMKSGDTELNGELCVNDDVVVGGNYRYKSAKSKRVHIQALDFINSRFTELRADTDVGVINLTSSSAAHRYGAPVAIPVGATVTGITLYLFEDSSDGTGKFTDIKFNLRKRGYPALYKNYTDVCEIDLTSSAGLPHTVSTTTVTNGLVGANEQFFLSLQLEVSNTIDIGIFGAAVDYTTTSLNP